MGREADWRGIVAALVGDASATALARVILGDVRDDVVPGLTAKKSRRALEVLHPYVKRGDGDSEVSLDREKLQALLQPPENRRSHDDHSVVVDKFITNELRLTVFPSRPEQRRVVLEFLARRLFRPNEELQEVQVNERLKVVTDDFVTLRRYLIDFALLTRFDDGTSYRLAEFD
ncbi:hypothetical protein DHOM_00835 [Dermabacter hominis 1368]|uniref:DUF2087 domain-containing protein n=1 Tax=Dermabacter hominis 1368 TaxID=1450519 RepID=A0ABR4SMB3_9MICO|nr:hypothetical protein DHOM_00835 [Dermabacter hominis 1368]